MAKTKDSLPSEINVNRKLVLLELIASVWISSWVALWWRWKRRASRGYVAAASFQGCGRYCSCCCTSQLFVSSWK